MSDHENCCDRANVVIGPGAFTYIPPFDRLQLEIENARLRTALAGVIGVSDRKTKEFDFARSAISAPSLTPLADAYKRLRDTAEHAKKRWMGHIECTDIFPVFDALAEITKLEGGEL